MVKKAWFWAGFWGLVFAALGASLLPSLDLAVADSFYRAGLGFSGPGAAFWQKLSDVTFVAARVIALGLPCLALGAALRKKSLCGLSARAFLFLWVALLVGPGLVVNVGLKDNFGRARPRDVSQYGGVLAFSPAGEMSNACKRNCSFVSGDAAFGFYLSALAFVVPWRRRRTVFVAFCGLGAAMGFGRMVIGAHFLSDVLNAAVIVLVFNALCYRVVFRAWPTLESSHSSSDQRA